VLSAVRASGGCGAMVTDDQIVSAIQLLAETEGIFTEPAGGTTLAAAIQLIERGVIPRDESIVVGITGNGYKTGEVVRDRVPRPVELGRSLDEFDAFISRRPMPDAVSSR
jgi:threonine synthase